MSSHVELDAQGRPAPAPDSVYGRDYYDHYAIAGRVGYSRENWLADFRNIADGIIRQLNPRTVLDVGCAKGFLVECLRERGVEAYGLDFSDYAISQVRDDIRRYCWVGSAADPLTRSYDLIFCNEVCEHLSEADANEAIRQMTSHAEAVLFSSTPGHFDDPTHVNVRPIIDWLRLFARSSFAPDETFDVGFLAPWAMLLRRANTPPSDERLRRFAYLKNRAFVAWELRNSPEVLGQLAAIRNSRAWKLIGVYARVKAGLKKPFEQLFRGAQQR